MFAIEIKTKGQKSRETLQDAIGDFDTALNRFASLAAEIAQDNNEGEIDFKLYLTQYDFNSDLIFKETLREFSYKFYEHEYDV